jgi:hypothetical protein
MFRSLYNKHVFLALSIVITVCSCDSKPNNYKYTPPSKQQIECLKEYSALDIQEMKDDIEVFQEVIKSHDDNEIINYELASRRNKERLCMIKANCYDKSKGIEFSDCVNDVIPQYEN